MYKKNESNDAKQIIRVYEVIDQWCIAVGYPVVSKNQDDRFGKSSLSDLLPWSRYSTIMFEVIE